MLQIRIVLLSILMFCIVEPAWAAQEAERANVYEISARFDPSDGRLQARGSVTLVATTQTGTIELLLNGGLVLERFEPDREAEVSVENGISIDSYELPHTQRITIRLEQPLAAGDSLSIAFGYAGRITTESIEIGRGVVSPGWSELTMEALWYPVWLDGPRLRSDVRLMLPEGYQVTGPGRVEPLSDGQWRLRPNGIVSGRITFITSNAWVREQRPLGDGMSGVVLTITPEPRSEAILDATEAAFDAYRSLFGPPDSESDTLTIVYANSDIGLRYPRQAYSTGGDFIVLDESEERVQIDTLHHEIAHFWWSRGQPGTPDEFLSESISEFLAVRHGGDVWGEEWLADRRTAMQRRSDAIEGSLLDIDGLSATRQDLLYNRGPTALFALQDRLGRAAIDALLSQLYDDRVGTMAGFTEILAGRHGQESADWFAARL